MLAVITAGSLAIVAILQIRLQDHIVNENWKARWIKDTAASTKEIKNMAQMVADASYAKVQAEAQVAALQAQIADLTKQLAETQRSAKPAP